MALLQKEQSMYVSRKTQSSFILHNLIDDAVWTKLHTPLL